MPFVPPRPVSDVTLVQHVRDKNDPHGTLKRAKQVRMFGSYPSDSDLDALNDGDLVIVYSTGVQYRASVKDVNGSRIVSLIELKTSEVTKADVDAKADRATTLSGYGITDAATKEELAAKADIVDGKVPASQLPSYVDDVLEYDTMSAFPATGESGKIYVAKDTNLTYRWSGTQYVEISPLPVLDDEVTKASANGVKSSGIWSWVKSLLPHWLTSDYAEPATVASVANKRDKDDLAVYSVTRTENMDWTWESENKEFEAALNSAGAKPYWYGTGHWTYDDVVYVDGIGYVLNHFEDNTNRSAVELAGNFDRLDVQGKLYATARRPRYMDETLGQEKPNQQLAAVATDDEAKPADGSLMKYDAANDRLVKAVEGTDYLKTHQDISGKFDATHDFDGENASLSWEAFYLAVHAPYGLYVLRGGIMADEYDQHGQYVRTHSLFQKADRATTLSGYGITDGATKTELAAKRDLTDNVCRKSEFTEWICNPPRTEFGGVYSIRYDSPVKVYSLFDNEEVVEEIYSPTDDKLDLEFVGYCTATRSAVCSEGKKFVTSDVVDGKVSSAVSTNNPAFVSAVQNTPAPEPGQGEDPPWGTWGTVGAAIAGLVAGLKWLKDKVFDSAGNIQDQFATDLLGKQVANAKVRYALATASSATMADRTVNILTMTQSETLTFPTATTHDNKTYARDFLLKLTYTSGTMELPQGVTKVGDELSFEAGKTYLIAFTEIESDKFYVRSIDITEAQA